MSDKIRKLKKKRITMYFDLLGLISTEKYEVLEEDELSLTLNELGHDDKGKEGYRKFEKKTGRCINDNTYLGARRYIKPIKDKRKVL